jgi:hypothetical protein
VPRGSAVAARDVIQNRCARPHDVEEAQSVSSQPVVNPASHLEGVA